MPLFFAVPDEVCRVVPVQRKFVEAEPVVIVMSAGWLLKPSVIVVRSEAGHDQLACPAVPVQFTAVAPWIVKLVTAEGTT